MKFLSELGHALGLKKKHHKRGKKHAAKHHAKKHHARRNSKGRFVKK